MLVRIFIDLLSGKPHLHAPLVLRAEGCESSPGQAPPPRAAFPTNGVAAEAGRRLSAVLATGCGAAAQGEEAFPGVLSPLSNTLHILTAR